MIDSKRRISTFKRYLLQVSLLKIWLSQSKSDLVRKLEKADGVCGNILCSSGIYSRIKIYRQEQI
jgi:hypothetical protein